MERRNVLRAVLASVASALAGSAAAVEDSSRASRVVYHLIDQDKVEFVLASTVNHLIDARDDAFCLAVVVHGPALRSFRRQFPFSAVDQGMRSAIERGAKFYACPNTMAAESMTLDDLLPGFKLTNRGGVAYLADLQAQGWAYLRP